LKPKEVTTQTLAEAIRAISASMNQLSRSGLNRRAVIALIADHSKLGKSTIEVVLNNLDILAERYTRKGED
jgi:hypothetical protein